jgi:hypothetical protein
MTALKDNRYIVLRVFETFSKKGMLECVLINEINPSERVYKLIDVTKEFRNVKRPKR